MAGGLRTPTEMGVFLNRIRTLDLGEPSFLIDPLLPLHQDALEVWSREKGVVMQAIRGLAKRRQESRAGGRVYFHCTEGCAFERPVLKF